MFVDCCASCDRPWAYCQCDSDGVPQPTCHCCSTRLVEGEGGEIPDEGRACGDCFSEWQEEDRAWKKREAEAREAGRREQEAS